MQKEIDEHFMKIALKEAYKAYNKNEIPVGVVIVSNGKIVSKGYNKKEKNNDPTEHAEIIAIKKATKKIKDWRLNNCEIYVTKEPCIMCAGAILEARLKRVIFGFKDNEKGGFGGKINILNFFDVKIIIDNGILEKESKEIFEKFFKKLRRGGWAVKSACLESR